jgi:hypothetical protein
MYGHDAHFVLSPHKVHVLSSAESGDEERRVKMTRKKFMNQVVV